MANDSILVALSGHTDAILTLLSVPPCKLTDI